MAIYIEALRHSGLFWCVPALFSAIALVLSWGLWREHKAEARPTGGALRCRWIKDPHQLDAESIAWTCKLCGEQRVSMDMRKPAPCGQYERTEFSGPRARRGR